MKKPIKPERDKIFKKELRFDGKKSLADILREFVGFGIEDINISVDYGRTVLIEGFRQPTDIEYSRTLLAYERELNKYNAWYKRHKEELIRVKEERLREIQQEIEELKND